LPVLIFKTCIHIFKLQVLPVKQVEEGFIRFAKPLSISQMKQTVSLKPDLKLLAVLTNGSRCSFNGKLIAKEKNAK